VRACTTSEAAPPACSAAAHSSVFAVSLMPSRILAVTAISCGTARRTASVMRCMRSGSSSSMAPPPCRLTVGAGQPKLRSIPAGESPASRAAVSAMRSGWLPSNCATTGVPQEVLLPFSSSGQTRRKVRNGSTDPDTRMNSQTAPS